MGQLGHLQAFACLVAGIVDVRDGGWRRLIESLQVFSKQFGTWARSQGQEPPPRLGSAGLRG